MTKFKGLITLVSLTFLLISCGLNPPGYKIYRNDDMLLVFLSMKDSSKIADATVNNQRLNVSIMTGDRIVKRALSLKKRFYFDLIKDDETLNIIGTDRINGYGVVHLTVISPEPRKSSITIFQNGRKINNFSKKPRPFPNSGAYRDKDRISAYCMLPDRILSSWETSMFGISYRVEETSKFVDEDMNSKGHAVLKIDTDELGMPNQSVSFLLKDLKPHETVEVDDKQKIGDDLYLVDLKVIPKKTN